MWTWAGESIKKGWRGCIENTLAEAVIILVYLIYYGEKAKNADITYGNGQGTGIEYLGTDGNWYHESILKEFNRGGISNPSFNENAARLTHIPVGGKQ